MNLNITGLRVLVTAGASGIGLVAGTAAESAAQRLEEVVVTDTKLGRMDDGPSDYDPWEPFNDTMFTFNHDYMDRDRKSVV